MISMRLKNVILRTLDLSEFDLQDDTHAYQVPGWDSLSHIIIITAIEKEYGIRFKFPEIMRLNNLGDLQALVDKKTNAI
jgi:Acyl carrier protein